MRLRGVVTARLTSIMLAGVATLSLASCGGDDGGSTSNVPDPPPTPAPTPTPVPSPPVGFDDAEYRASQWLVSGNALSAFEEGGSGEGAIFAIIDSGIASSDPEFNGRVLTGLDGEGASTSHGSGVARVAVGARNGIDTMGVAFEASILSYNTLDCTTECFHSLDAVAAAVDEAIAEGARVINMSLIGSSSRDPLFSAIKRATDAGVIVVIAAGNRGADDPNGFALENAQFAGSDLVVIAGSHDEEFQINPGSDRAGAGEQWYLAAYSTGATSLSAPVISGAVALIAASYPELTGQQIVEILRETAQDAGASGRDAVYGYGILDIGAAFERAGQPPAD